MRVLITTDTVGGVWRFALELTDGLLQAGDSVALVSFGQSLSVAQHAECTQLTSKWGAAFRYIPSEVPLEWMQDNERSFEAGLMVLARVTQQFAPEIVHSNQFCFGALDLAIPKVVTAHSDALSWARSCRGETLKETPWLDRYCRLVQHGLDNADAITAPTFWMLHALREGFNVSRETRVIANGRRVSPGPACTRRLQSVTVGRLWDEAKDVSLLEKVASPVPLVVAGATECDGSAITRLRSVKLLGMLPERKLLRLFQESAIYVCTSRYEPFGLAPLEAALCGCAVVARKIDSLVEVWGDAALYFHDADDLSELLNWLCEDRESLRKAQQRAMARAGNYTREEMVGSYRALYSALTEMASVS